MRIQNNNLFVNRGESFTLDTFIRYKDNSPMIISSELKNSYILVSVASSRYNQADRYVLNLWLDLANVPKFAETSPLDITKCQRTNASTGQREYYTWNNLLEDLTAGDGTIDVYDTDNNTIQIRPNKFVFTDGTLYKYWSDNTLKEYGFPLSVPFETEVTSEWVEQSYSYSILLVTGELTGDEDKPIKVENSIPILVDAKISVSSNINGGIYGY